MKEKLCLLAGLCVAAALALPTAAAALERTVLTIPPEAVFVSPQVGTGNMMVSGSRLLETLAAMGYDASACKDGCFVTLTLSNGQVYQAARVGADGTASISHVGFSSSEIQGATVKVDRGEDPLPQLPAGTTTLYVSPTGNDRNPGTQAQPLATIGRALRLVAAASKGNASGWRVLLLSGTYFLKATAVLDARFSGSPNAPFVIGAAPGATPVVSGARDLHPIWRDGANGMKTTQIDGGFDEIFLDGIRQIRARYPNYDPNIAIFNGYSADATSRDRVARWRNPAGGFLHAQHQSEWGDVHYRIEGKTAANDLKLSAGTGNNRFTQPHVDRRYVENIYEELDAPKEWFYDTGSRTLSYIPEAGTDLSKAVVSGAVLEELFTVTGTEAAPVHDIAIRGLTMTGTRYTFMKTTEPLLRSDWKIYRGGAVLIEGGKNIEIADNTMTQLGGNAVFVSGYNRNITVRGNEIFDIGASAVAFVGRPEAVRSPGFEYGDMIPYAQMDKTPGPKTNAYPAESTAEDNLIHNIGRKEKQVAGVEISMASKITVSHNSIYDVPRAGINIGDGTWGGHVIEYNDVFKTVLETGDHGSFNSWGRDRYWGTGATNGDDTPELVANPGMPYLDAMDPVIIRNNRFRCDHGWDIDLDDGSTNYIIENNVLLNGGLKNREGFKRIDRNNILVNSTFHPHVWYQNSLDRFEHNIVMRPYQPIGISQWGQSVDNNMFVTKTALANAQGQSNSDKVVDKNSISGFPLFLNPSVGDYRVSDKSPALTIGFKNFPMDQFGVTEPRLKAKAETPELPTLTYNDGDNTSEAPSDFLGATVKSVETEGERSSLGLPSVSGVMVQSVAKGSIAARGGLLAKDAILGATVGDKEVPVQNVADLNTILVQVQSTGTLKLSIYRGQSPSSLTLTLTP